MGTQELALAMHVMPGDRHFGDTMQNLVNTNVIGRATMYGISVYQEDSSLVLDKSQKENVRNSVESRRLSVFLDYAAAAWLASGFRETVLAKEASSSGISR